MFVRVPLKVSPDRKRKPEKSEEFARKQSAMALEIENIMDDKDLLDRTIEECLHEVLGVFYKEEVGMMVENVSSIDGSMIDCFEGRLINPGHNLEAGNYGTQYESHTRST